MKQKILGVIAVGAVLAFAGGCATAGGGEAEDGEFSTIVDGTLTVGLSPDFPPMEYMDGETLIGSDVDLITAAAERMGLEVAFEHQKFDQLINSVRTDRVDIVISGMSDTVERQKTLDFIDYYSSTGRFYTLPDQASEFGAETDVCGAAVAVSTKTDYFPALQRFSADVCEAADLPPVNIVGADSGAAARLQLDQGRAELAVQGAENLAYFEQQEPGKYEIVLDVLIDQPFAAAVRKGNTELAEAVSDAFQELYDDGTTEEILTEYGIEQGLREPAINEVGSE